MATTNFKNAEIDTSLQAKPVFTVEEFCFSHGNISRAFFYKLVKQGLGPRLLKVGSRTFVTAEAAVEWRRDMETRSAAESAENE